MGFFGEKKQISVASVAYNMAGPEADRPDFLKTTVIGKVTAQPNAQSMGDHIVTTYLNGPGMRLRSFARWSRLNGYSAKIQLDPGQLSVSAELNLDTDTLAAQIPVGAGETAIVQTAKIGTAEYTYWVDQYVAINYPEQVGTPYESEFTEATNTITITFGDDTTASFSPVGFDSNAIYLYSGYNVGTGEEVQPRKIGTVDELDPLDPWPDLDDWDEVSLTETPTTIVLNTTVHTKITYSDTTPGSESTVITPRDEEYDVIEGEWEKEEYKGRHPTETSKVYKLRSWMYWNQTHTIEGEVDVDVTTQTNNGVVRTTTITTTIESLVLVRTVQIDTQEVWLNGVGNARVFIYRYQSGNPALDAMFRPSFNFGAMFPFIPVRLYNQFISDSFHPDYWAWTQRAYRRVMRQRISKVIETIEDNPSLKDIDFAYVMFGVALNTKESASIRYLYELFQEILLGGAMDSGQLVDWVAANDAAAASVAAFEAWSAAQSEPGNPLFATDPPAILPYPQAPTYALILRGAQDLNFNIEVSWTGIDEDTGSGLLKPDAKPGDLWISKGGEFDFPQYVYNENGLVLGPTIRHDGITIYWQITSTTWRKLDIYGLNHRNHIYGGKSVNITAHEALDDPDDTGFIIPLHEEIYRRVVIVPATQASTACVHMVFNCYSVRKQKWYETQAFKILLIVVIIVITIVTAGAAGPAGAGILGANAVIGASLGFTGVAALVVGAVANAVAAMLITQIISYVATAAFGPQVGAIVAVIASIIALQVGTAYASGASLVGSLNTLMQPEVLMTLTAAATDGAATYLRAQTQETILKAQNILTQLNEEIAEVAEKREEIFGTESRGFLDPLTLANVTYAPITESPQTFLTRTLMTGTDIANASHEMLNNFVDLTITTPMPGVS